MPDVISRRVFINYCLVGLGSGAVGSCLPKEHMKSIPGNQKIIDNKAADWFEPSINLLDSGINSGTALPLNDSAIMSIKSTRYHYPLKYAVIGDSETQNNEKYKRFLEDIKAQNKENPDNPILFIINIGDFVKRGSEEKYEKYLNMIMDYPIPILHVPGNHEMEGNGRYIYQKFFGSSDYYFDYDSRFIILSNTKADHGSYAGFSDAQLKFLEDKLDDPIPERKIVICHVPPKWPFSKYINLLEFKIRKKLNNEDKFHGLIKKYDVNLVLSGHYHGFGQEKEGSTIYVISGGGGQPTLRIGKLQTEHYTKAHHYIVFTHNSDSIRGEVNWSDNAKERNVQPRVFYSSKKPKFS